MPRVHFVKKSRKEFPGIPKGSSYYHWSFAYGGGPIRSLTRPRPSQLTQSEYYSTAYGIQEDLEDLTLNNILDGTDISEYAERARELGEMASESLYNMPEGLQQGDTGMLLEQRTQDMEEWASELENIEMDDRLPEEIIDEIRDVSANAIIE